jgi:hypothetical protein
MGPIAAIVAIVAIVLAVAHTLACSGASAITDCVADGGVTPICGFANPEDLAPLPGGSWLAVSQYGGPAGDPGSLIAYRFSDGRRLDLFPGGDDLEPAPGRRSAAWGDPECDGPPNPATFSPHGIDSDLGAHRLAVVNHGGRQSVELFEIGRSRRGPALAWRGCVTLSAADWPNDVALLPDGGFLVTRMLPASGLSQLLALPRMLMDFNTGWVLEWRPGAGLVRVPNSAGNGPNGIAASADGSEIFFSEWGGRRLVRLRRQADGSVLRRSLELPDHLPDNWTWTRAGRLLVTAQRATIGSAIGCAGISEGTCALPFSVFEVEPATFTKRLVLRHDATAIGAASVALEVGPSILIGTLQGDRLGRAAFRR